MISPAASAALAGLFDRAVRDYVTVDGEDRCQIHTVPAAPDETVGRHLVALGLSSFQFRVVTLFDFPTDAAMAAHLARISRCPGQKLEGRALADAYGEFVNMVCGSVNRGLQGAFRHSGMSTPVALESGCRNHLAILDPAHRRTAEVLINEQIRIYVSFAVCVARGGSLDFTIDHRAGAPAEETAGELELF